MADLTHLSFDTFEMTPEDITRRRASLEVDGWVLSREITTRDPADRTHVQLVFSRAVRDVDFPAPYEPDDVPSSGFKESNEPAYETRPRRGLAYYILTVVLAFTLFILSHPKQDIATVAAGVSVGARELVLPSSVKANSNAAQAVPVKRIKPKTPKKIAKAEDSLLAPGGFSR